MVVRDFTTDLSDGLKLIALLEVLTGQKFPRYVKNPRFAAQKLANITEALEFMTRYYGIKFVGCNSADIMEGKQNQCMGVIFLLINKIKTLQLEADSELTSSTSSPNLITPPVSPHVQDTSPNHNADSNQSKGAQNPVSSPRRDNAPNRPTPAPRKPYSASTSVAPSQATLKPTQNAPPLVRAKPMVPPRAYSKSTTAVDTESAPTGAVLLTSLNEEVPSDPALKKEYYTIRLQAAIRGYLARRNHQKKIKQQRQIMQIFASDPKATSCLIRLQSTVRGMLERNSAHLRAKRKRNEIAKEILTTEEKYVKSLTILVTVYMKALEGLGESVMPPAKIRSIFSEIKVIMSYNQLIYNRLKARMEAWYSNGQTLGDIFLQFTDFLKVYTAYVNNYNESMNTLQDMTMNNPSFVEAIQTCRSDPRVSGMELSSFLIMPIQRIPRYVLLLSDLFKNTPETHKDHADLKAALSKMEGVASYVNQKKREAENLLGVTTVASHLVGLENANEFNQPHRRYVRQGPLQELEAGAITQKALKNRYFFLFTDCLICTKENTGVLGRSKLPPNGLDIEALRNSDVQFKYLYSVNLLGAVINEIPEQNKITNMFELVVQGGRKILFSAPTAQLKEEWIQDLDEMIMSCLEKHRSRIGVPLEEERREVPVELRTPSLTGYLYKRSESGTWKKRYFVLTQDVLTYYPDIVSSMDEKAIPKTIPLLFAGIFHVPLLDRPFCLRLFTKARVYNLSSETAHDRLQWVNMVRAGISKRLSEIESKIKANTMINTAMIANTTTSLAVGSSLANGDRKSSPARSEKIEKRPDSDSEASTPVAASPAGSSSPAPSSEKRKKKEKSEKRKKAATIASPVSIASSSEIASNATEEEEQPATPASDEPSDEKKNGKSSKKEKSTRKKKLRRDQTISKITKTADVYKFSSSSSKISKHKMVLKHGEISLYKPGKSKPVSVIDLLLVQTPESEVEAVTIKDQTYYKFTLVSSDRKFVFATDNEEESLMWLEYVQASQEALTKSKAVKSKSE